MFSYVVKVEQSKKKPAANSAAAGFFHSPLFSPQARVLSIQVNVIK